jgi:hypothetical protein
LPKSDTCLDIHFADTFFSCNNVYPLETGYFREATQTARDRDHYYGKESNYKGNKLAKVLMVRRVAFRGWQKVT